MHRTLSYKRAVQSQLVRKHVLLTSRVLPTLTTLELKRRGRRSGEESGEKVARIFPTKQKKTNTKSPAQQNAIHKTGGSSWEMVGLKMKGPYDIKGRYRVQYR